MPNYNSYQLLQDIFKNNFEQLKFAELKNSILLTLQIGIFFLIAKEVKHEYILIILSFYAVNIFITSLSFFPHLSNITFLNNKQKDVSKNIFYFESTKNYKEIELLSLIEGQTGETNLISDRILKHLSNQIIIIASITSKKYLIFKITFYIFTIINIVFFLLMIL